MLRDPTPLRSLTSDEIPLKTTMMSIVRVVYLTLVFAYSREKRVTIALKTTTSMYMSLICSDSGATGETLTLGERRSKIWKETMASHFNDVLQG